MAEDLKIIQDYVEQTLRKGLTGFVGKASKIQAFDGHHEPNDHDVRVQNHQIVEAVLKECPPEVSVRGLKAVLVMKTENRGCQLEQLHTSDVAAILAILEQYE